MAPEVRPGDNHPFGAHCRDGGVNFALFSEHAQKVELCLFDNTGQHEFARLPLFHDAEDVWHGFVPGLGPGAFYGYRVHGPYQPQLGHRFNPHKLLLDPYARVLSAEHHVSELDYAHVLDDPRGDLSFDTRDNAGGMPKCVVPGLSAGATLPLARRPADALIYELHVRGFTMRLDGIPETERGTFSGLAQDQAIAYLKALGISSIELMPVQYFVDEPALLKRGLRNYWGYNTIGFFAPANRYLVKAEPQEFRHMVARMHDAGIEVLLDVVYNHTAEGGQLGPTLSFRGIDNCSYYRLDPHDKRRYIDDTGCGNTLNIRHPRVLQLVTDSLRYWVSEMGVDGFRFDLATVLGREHYGFDPGSGFFDVLRQDPLLNRIRLIAEPWDVGPGGYQLGQFPAGWSEWNDRFRDTTRRFWRGDDGMLPDLARCLHGSSDLFEHNRRTPRASINYVSSHDGFTLSDLVSYEQRHNAANIEDNHDGHHSNFSINCGVEGASSDPRILALRRCLRRNLMATLLFAQGTPMLLAGDELGRTQQGNNNAYCQDSALSWIDWSLLERGEQQFLDYVRYVVSLRRQHALLRWPRFIHNREEGPGATRCLWLRSDGSAMGESEWSDHALRYLAMHLIGPAEDLPAPREHLLVLFNAAPQEASFCPPSVERPGCWQALLHTALEDYRATSLVLEAGQRLQVPARSLCLFRLVGAD